MVEQWAQWTLKACRSDGDFPTVGALAVVPGVSASSYRDGCRLLKIWPHDARDFTRTLRLVTKSRGRPIAPDTLLKVSDPRTLERLLDRAGITEGASVSVEEFLRRQRLVPQANKGLEAVRKLLEDGKSQV